ncbi:PLP-dependent aminotransferase family protein [Lapidilactobacillus achengensis]|uniref:PLP-dependent aminotransferase family protein n=1 Tax=Lapidilactobacillus achengensis TaxID=2486000 RepID=A0ABW1UKQ4_9LACO|nr:PLP-dependent aminotransferase family protein [Lapidilactobacillus achengensis]
MKSFATRTALTSNTGVEDLIPDFDAKLISFAGGLPDPKLFPKKELALSSQRVLLDGTENPLQYHNAKGYYPLRKLIATALAQEGAAEDPHHILLTQGAQQGLDLVAKLFLNPHDRIAVEAPTYVGALAAFTAYEPTYLELPMSPDGLDLDLLERALKQTTIKFLYTVPNFQNPTGFVMSLTKRQRLVQLAQNYDFYILEDDPYKHLRYAGADLPSIRSLDHSGHVISLGSFSKILAPGLRLGWLVADDPIYTQIRLLKDGADLESPALIQQIVADYLVNNDFSAHLQQVQADYQQRRDWMLSALETNLPAGWQTSQPNGGFFLWVTGPENVDLNQLLRTEIGPQDHILYVPSTNLYASKNVNNGARLSYAGASHAQIDAGIKVLCDAFRAQKPQCGIPSVATN